MSFVQDYIKKSQALPYEKRVKLMWKWVVGTMVVVLIVWVISIPARFNVESRKLTLGNFISQIKESYKTATAPVDNSKAKTDTPVSTPPDNTQAQTPAPTSDVREQSSNDVKLAITKVDTSSDTLTVHFTVTSSSEKLVSLPAAADVQIIQAGKTIPAGTLLRVATDSTVFPTTLLSNTTVEATATFSGVTADQPYQISFNNLVAGSDGQPFSFAFNY